MSQPNKKFRDYYATDKYRGFYKIRERVFKLSGKTTMTFTNGKKEVFASGLFKEAALTKIFDQIDNIIDAKDSTEEETEKEDLPYLHKYR